MRNVERARADADRRNATLQQEMEQFFETFGELNAEARKTSRIVQSFWIHMLFVIHVLCYKSNLSSLWKVSMFTVFQLWSWSTPNSTHFGYLPYLIPPILEISLGVSTDELLSLIRETYKICNVEYSKIRAGKHQFQSNKGVKIRSLFQGCRNEDAFPRETIAPLLSTILLPEWLYRPACSK